MPSQPQDRETGRPRRGIRLNLRKTKATSNQPARLAKPEAVQFDADGFPLRKGSTAQRVVPLAGLFMRTWVLLLIAALIISVTVVWTWQRYQTNQFIEQLDTHLARGKEALSGGQYEQATRELAEAAVAARGLGLTHAAGREAVRLHREAQCWSTLAFRTPDEMVPAGLDAANQPQPALDALRNGLVGQTMIVEGLLRRGASQAQLQLDWVWYGEGYTVELALDDVTVGSLWPLEQPRQALLGVRIASVDSAPREPSHFVLHVAPDGCIPLTATGPLKQLGWPIDEAVSQMLTEQQAWETP